MTGTSTLWGSAAAMKAYDIMLLSCEGNDNSGAGAASTAMRQAVKDFADAGGRVFGFALAQRLGVRRAGAVADRREARSGAHGFTSDITVPIVTSFPKGMAFAEWMVNVGGSTNFGQMVIHGAEHSVDSTSAWRAELDRRHRCDRTASRWSSTSRSTRRSRRRRRSSAAASS